jgi:hypothetical protein
MEVGTETMRVSSNLLFLPFSYLEPPLSVCCISMAVPRSAGVRFSLGVRSSCQIPAGVDSADIDSGLSRTAGYSLVCPSASGLQRLNTSKIEEFFLKKSYRVATMLLQVRISTY